MTNKPFKNCDPPKPTEKLSRYAMLWLKKHKQKYSNIHPWKCFKIKSKDGDGD